MTKHADYLSEIFDVDRLCENADQHLKPQMHKFEMLVGTGVSGTLMAGILATHLGCDFGIVRKPNVNTHSNNDVEPGNPDPRCRWLFVDDLICSGQTRVYVRTMMAGEGYHNFVGTYLASSKGTLLMGEAEVDRVPPIPVKDKLRSRPQEFYGESPV